VRRSMQSISATAPHNATRSTCGLVRISGTSIGAPGT